MTNIAPVKWAQRADSLYLTISLSDVVEPVINLSSNKLTFTGKSNGKDYSLDLEFVSLCMLIKSFQYYNKQFLIVSKYFHLLCFLV